MSTHNLKKYKMAKVLVKDLANMISIMLEYENSMVKYQKYSPIKKLLINTRDNRLLIQQHLKKQRTILKTKGEETIPLLIGDKK